MISPLPVPLPGYKIKWHQLRMRHELEEIERVEYVRLAHEKMGGGMEHSDAVAEAAMEARDWFAATYQAEIAEHEALKQRQAEWEASHPALGET